MSETEIQKLARKHLDAWQASFDAVAEERTTLTYHVGEAIKEAIAERDKLWHEGNATLRFERDRYERAVMELQSREERE